LKIIRAIYNKCRIIYVNKKMMFGLISVFKERYIKIIKNTLF